MRLWQVRLLYSKNLGEPDDELAEMLDSVAEELSEYDAAVGGGYDGLAVTMVVEAVDYVAALASADAAVRFAAGDHDIEPGDVVEVLARTWDRVELSGA